MRIWLGARVRPDTRRLSSTFSHPGPITVPFSCRCQRPCHLRAFAIVFVSIQNKIQVMFQLWLAEWLLRSWDFPIVSLCRCVRTEAGSGPHEPHHIRPVTAHFLFLSRWHFCHFCHSSLLDSNILRWKKTNKPPLDVTMLQESKLYI